MNQSDRSAFSPWSWTTQGINFLKKINKALPKHASWQTFDFAGAGRLVHVRVAPLFCIHACFSCGSSLLNVHRCRVWRLFYDFLFGEIRMQMSYCFPWIRYQAKVSKFLLVTMMFVILNFRVRVSLQTSRFSSYYSQKKAIYITLWLLLQVTK